MNISFIGLGKLGLPLACCLAESGHNILGVDKNEYILDSLNKKTLPFFESGLSALQLILPVRILFSLHFCNPPITYGVVPEAAIPITTSF